MPYFFPLLVLLLAAASQADPPAVRTGAEVLAAEGFERLGGMRVGLVTNHTARVGEAHLADLLAAAPGSLPRPVGVGLAALFAPEHGLRGQEEAGADIRDGVDEATGAPVFSLYGEARAPTPAMLEGLDVLVFDMQDVGARFYTYVSTMGLAMAAAARAGLPFVVLDRPNPLGGEMVSGFVMEEAHASFVGMYPIPIQHGLTVGEMAKMIAGEGWLPGLERLDLRIVEMAGWRRAMRWPETGLPFLPPSPNIPDVETALVYPGTGLIEGTAASDGRGTEAPFLLVGAAWADAPALADTLNARGLAGVRFEAARFTPRSIPGRAASPKGEGAEQQGVRLVVTDAAAFRPVEVGVHVLHALHGQRPGGASFFQPGWLARLAGTERLRRMLERGASPEAIIASWAGEVAAFEQARRPYLLYE